MKICSRASWESPTSESDSRGGHMVGGIDLGGIFFHSSLRSLTWFVIFPVYGSHVNFLPVEEHDFVELDLSLYWELGGERQQK